MKAHMRRTMKFCQRGPKFDNVFFLLFFDEEIEDPNITINGPMMVRH